MRHRHFTAILTLLLILHFGDSFGGESRQLDDQEALALLYGGVVWKSDKLKSYFEGQDYGYVSVAFETSYVEQGQNKRVVIVRITPRPAEDYACHACAPVIGGGIFKWSATGWAVESKGEIVGWGNSFGETFSLVEVGPDRYGVLDNITDVHQGYEDKSIRLVISYNGSFRSALNVGFGEKPGPGACEDVSAPEQYAGIQFLRTKSEFFDVHSKLKFNEGPCEKFSVRNQAARYRFTRGIYRQLGH